MYLLKLLIILQLFIIQIFAIDKLYPIEGYYILNKKYYNRLKNNIKSNDSLFKKAVYTGTTFVKIKSLKRSDKNYINEVTKVLYNGKTVNYDNFFENDPFNILLNAKTINKNVIAEFTTAFGEELIKRKMNYVDEYKIYNPEFTLTEQEKEIRDMYIYMLTNGENLDIDALLNDELSKFSDISHSLELDYAISCLENENIVQWIKNKNNNNPTYSYLYNKYGVGIDTNNFLNVVTKNLIYENNSLGVLLDNQDKWQNFKNLIEILMTEYIFSIDMNYYLYDNNTNEMNSIFNLLSSNIKSTLYDFYLKVIKYIDKSERSTIDMVLQELLLSNMEYNNNNEKRIEKRNINRDNFFKSIEKILEIYLSTNSLVKTIKINKYMSDENLVDQLLNAHELARISVLDILLDDKNENFETIIQCFDIIIKYANNLSKDYYNSLVSIANQYIIQYTNFIGDNAYRSGNYDNIISKMIVPYQYNNNFDENDYIKNIITAVTLIKQSLNGIFEMGDDLVYGYERMLCFEINDKNDNKAFITNILNKDCIFKGARSSNEAIYKLVKYYYDIFIINCINDLETFNQLTMNEFTQFYYNVLYREDTIVQSIVVPTIKLYNDLYFQDINYIFNVINEYHPDKYINEAAKLIKTIGLCMLDNTIITEDLMKIEKLNYELKDIVLPPLKSGIINQIHDNYLYWGDSVVDKEYSGYFEYQYYSLLYYIEDLEEEVRNNNKLNKIIKDIRTQAKTIVYNYDAYKDNFVIIKEIIYKYERMVDILAEYIYQYGYDSIDTDTLLTKYLPDDDFESGYYQLISYCIDFEEEYENIMNNTLVKQLIDSHHDILSKSKNDIYNYSIEALNYNNVTESESIKNTKRSLRILNNKNNHLYGNIYKRADWGSAAIGASVGFVQGIGESVIEHNIDYSHYEGLKKMGLKLISSAITLGVGSFTSFFNSGNLPFNVDGNYMAIGYLPVYTATKYLSGCAIEKYYSPNNNNENNNNDNLNEIITGNGNGNGNGNGAGDGNGDGDGDGNGNGNGAGDGNGDGDGDGNGNQNTQIGTQCSNNSMRKRDIKYNKFVKRRTNCNKKQVIRDFNNNKQIAKKILKESTSGISPMSAADAQTVNDVIDENKNLSIEFANAESGSITNNPDENSGSIISSEDIDKGMSKENTKFNTNLKAATEKNLIKNEDNNKNKYKKYKRRRKNKNNRINNNNRKNSSSVKNRSE